MLETIAVVIVTIFSSLLALCLLVGGIFQVIMEAKEYKANKHAVLYRGTVLTYEGIKKYAQGRREGLIFPKTIYKSYFKYDVQFWINGREHVESVLFKEQKQIGEVVEAKCIWNKEEVLHPIDIGKVELFQRSLIGLLFLAILLVPMACVYFIA